MKRYSPKPWIWVESLIRGRRSRDLFENVRTYGLFIGHSRSGHSLIGSLLNAHRNVLMSHELGALRFIRARFGRDQLFWLHYAKDKQFERKRRTWTGYDFRVPNQWQGRCADLQVIGDKRGGLTTVALMRWPHLLERLQKTVQIPVRFIQTLRHPLDNIASVCRANNTSVDQAIHWYREATAVNAALMHRLGDSVHTMHFEDFVAHPHGKLRELCSFLDISVAEDYLDDCASILFEKPQTARQRVCWTRQQVDQVRRIADRYPFLQGYDYDGAELAADEKRFARIA